MNFSASKGDRNYILEIFLQPFLCRVENHPFSYYLVRSGLRYCINTARKSLLKQAFFVCFNQVLTHRINNEHFRELSISYVSSGALMSSNGYGATES